MCVCVSGKTELLYHLLCRCVLPVATGGLEVDVVFVDTDYSLDMLRLVSILDSRLNAGTHTHHRRRSRLTCMLNTLLTSVSLCQLCRSSYWLVRRQF